MCYQIELLSNYVSEVQHIIIFFPLVPSLESSLPYWSTELIPQFLDLSQAVGFLGRVISSSPGLYLNTGQHKHRKTRTHIKHPCPGRNSNPQSRPPSDRCLSMPQTYYNNVAITCLTKSLTEVRKIAGKIFD
jgi:hypothetical protein